MKQLLAAFGIPSLDSAIGEPGQEDRPGAGAEGSAPIANTLRLRYKTLDTGVPMKMVDIEILLKAVETKVALMLFLALLVGFSALWFVTRFDVIPPREGITVGSSEDVRRTPMPTAPIPRRESSQE